MKNPVKYAVSLLTLLMLVLTAAVQVNAQTVSAPKIASDGSVTFDCIWFGSFEQNYNEATGMNEISPVKWRVLDVEGDRALLISDVVMFTSMWYRSTTSGGRITWSNSLMRSALNGYGADMNYSGTDMRGSGFYDKAFKSDEKAAICETVLKDTGTTDKIFALSMEEAQKSEYGFGTADGRRVMGRTDFVNDVFKNSNLSGVRNNRPYYWTTRTSATNQGYDDIFCVMQNGGFIQVRASQDAAGVRPALWVDLSRGACKYAGTVSTGGAKAEITFQQAETVQSEEQAEAEEKKAKQDDGKTDGTESKIVNTVTNGNGIYKLSDSGAVLSKPRNKNITKLSIPATVSANGKKYKVVSVSAKACKGLKKLETVTIGKNINKIGKDAFRDCKKLKSITIKTSKLTSGKVGANAFKGINAKAKIKVPKAKLSAYKKLLKKKGVGKKAKITK